MDYLLLMNELIHIAKMIWVFIITCNHRIWFVVKIRKLKTPM
jgi:hypothetical protein